MGTDQQPPHGAGEETPEGTARDPGAMFAAACAPDATRWVHECAGAMSIIGIRRNREELRMAEACAPPDDALDVANHLAHAALSFGMTPGVAEGYADVGIMMRRMPRLAMVLRSRAHLPYPHLRTLARSTLPAPDELLPVLEERLLDLILPTRDGEAIRGTRWLHHRIRRIFEELAPELCPVPPGGDDLEGREAAAANEEAKLAEREARAKGGGDSRDDDPAPDTGSFEEFIGVEEGPCSTVITMQLANTRAYELLQTLAAIGADQNCSPVETVTHLARGTARVSVTLNVYRSWETGEMWMPGTEGWSSGAWAAGIMPDDWMDLVESARLCGDSAVDGYTPSEAQRAFIIGRDGTCRFPGCERPAHRAEGDHICNYDHDDPAAGGPTDTENLHCLCKLHHDLKTRKMWDVLRLADGTEYWTSRLTGMTAVSTPSGPLAGRHRTNFTARQMRKRRTLAAHNERRLRLLERERAIVERARRVAAMERDRNDAHDAEPPTPPHPSVQNRLEELRRRAAEETQGPA